MFPSGILCMDSPLKGSAVFPNGNVWAELGFR